MAKTNPFKIIESDDNELVQMIINKSRMRTKHHVMTRAACKMFRDLPTRAEVGLRVSDRDIPQLQAIQLFADVLSLNGRMYGVRRRTDHRWYPEYNARFQELMAAMPHFRSLLHLDVGRSRMNVESMDLLAEVLPQMHSLHSLSMEDALSMTVGDLTDYSPLSHASDLVRRLGVVLPLCKSLKKLDLKDNCIGKREGPGLEAANMLARVLPQCGKLTTLNLAANDIGETMPCDLIDRLPQIPSLEHLNLRQNKLFDEGDDAMMQLVEVLPKCTSLTHLNLSKNNIIPPDMALLAGALPHCTSLEHLDLSENLFGDKGVIHLAAVLPLCTTLRFINLRDCNLEEGGSLAMQQVLRNCPLPPTVQTE